DAARRGRRSRLPLRAPRPRLGNTRPGPRVRTRPDDLAVAATESQRYSRKTTAGTACCMAGHAIPTTHQRLVAAFKEAGVEGEIIFVNDGSPDDSREILAAIAERDPMVTVINHSRPFGSQSAFTSGMRIATGDGVVLLDGDLQDPPEV